MKKLLCLLITLILFLNVQNVLSNGKAKNREETLSAQGKQIFINEFLASNTTINPDNHDFDDYSDWLEIYNAEDQSVDLSGYFITDNLNNPTKWQIPDGAVINAKGFLLFWADGYDEVPGKIYTRPDGTKDDFITKYFHLNFKFSRAGEEIGIFSPDTVLIDSVTFGIQVQDISYGRKPDGGSSWYYFGEPTPETSNMFEGTLNFEYASVSVFTPQGGFYSSGQAVSLSTGSPSAIIRYTMDGSRPGSTSPEFTSDIILNSTTVLRARVFDVDKLPGSIVTQTYVVDENITLPVISIAAYPETLFDNDKGIYSNMLKNREIPISFEFFEPDGTPGFNIDAGLRITGQASFQYPQKPMTIYARDRFGVEEINYQLFPDRDISKYTNIYLRNSGTADNRHSLFRDALQHSLVINQMDIDCQAYRPAKTFINGEYWGIYNIREKLNTEYIASHHNVDPNNLDYLEFEFEETPVVIEGDPDNYYSLVNFMENNDLKLPDNYDYIASQIDINEFINYQITEIFCDNINWPSTNMRWWRERQNNSKWRWVLLDMDYGFGFTKDEGTYYFSSFYTNNTLELAVSAQGTWSENHPASTFVFRMLIENEKFKNEFIQRFAGYLNTTLHEDRVLYIVDSLKTQIFTEMPLHIDRWDDNPEELLYGDPSIPDMDTWQEAVELMRQFAINRPSHQRQHIIDFFNLNGTAKLTLNISDSDHGRVLISNIDMEDGYSGPHYRDVPIQFKAIPNVGYRFVRWQGLSSSTSDSISVVMTGNASITAMFEVSGDNMLPTSISADLELTSANSPYLASGDVTVNAGAELLIQSGVEIHMPESASININGSIMIEGSANSPVLIKPNTNSGVSEWGALCLDNASDSSSISHLIIESATHGADAENQMGAISANNSTLTIDNVRIENSDFPIFVKYGKVEIRNCILHSDKICDLINVKYATYALVENCDLRGNISYDTDAVDYDQIENGIIRGNRIYNFYGVNSDGIDLGEKSTNILIENNLIFNITDKGISIGQESTANVMGNVIVNCAQGVGIKDEGSYASIDGNTFYGNDFSIASFEKNIGVGGGSADAVNNIFSNSIRSTFFQDDLSTLDITYSLSDTDSLDGVGNVYADPLMGRNFRLLSNSPAINAGSPGSSIDPDGSTRDLGAYYYNSTENVYVIINEIHYNPADGENS
ncbi:CotH kinase family protein, partial [bacterium]|nr:CotH kinase family protein [bacterium]